MKNSIYHKSFQPSNNYKQIKMSGMNKLAAYIFSPEPMFVDGKPNPKIINEKKKFKPLQMSYMEGSYLTKRKTKSRSNFLTHYICNDFFKSICYSL